MLPGSSTDSSRQKTVPKLSVPAFDVTPSGPMAWKVSDDMLNCWMRSELSMFGLVSTVTSRATKCPFSGGSAYSSVQGMSTMMSLTVKAAKYSPVASLIPASSPTCLIRFPRGESCVEGGAGGAGGADEGTAGGSTCVGVGIGAGGVVEAEGDALGDADGVDGVGTVVGAAAVVASSDDGALEADCNGAASSPPPPVQAVSTRVTPISGARFFFNDPPEFVTPSNKYYVSCG